MPTHTPLRRLLNGTVIYGVGTVIVQLVNILLLPLLTAHLSPREYGAIAVLNLISLFFVAIVSCGIGTAIGICYFDYKERRERDVLVWSATGMLGVLVGGAILIGLLTLSRWAPLAVESLEFAPAASFMILAGGATILALPFDARLRLDERPIAFIIASLVSTLAVGLLALFFVMKLGRGATGYFEATLIGRIISLLTFIGIGGYRSTLGVSWRMARRLLRLGLPLAPQYLFLYALQFGGLEFVKRSRGLDDAGIYSVGLTLGIAINVVVSSIANAWAPFFLSFHDKREHATALFGRITSYYVLGVGGFSLFFYYLAPLLVSILSSPLYFEAYRVVGLSASACFVLGIYNLLLPPLYFAKEAGRATILLVIAVVALLITAALLVPWLGIRGAAFAQIGAYTTLVLSLHLWNRSQGERYLQIRYEPRRMSVFLTAYGISAIVLSSLPALSVVQTCAIFGVHLTAMTVLVLALLKSEERRAAWEYAMSFIHGWTSKR